MGEQRAYFGGRLKSVLNRTEPEHMPSAMRCYGRHASHNVTPVLRKKYDEGIYDADLTENEAVRAALGRLLDSLAGVSLGIEVQEWEGAKGIADFLNSTGRNPGRA
jgi:hypothetical protein